MVGLAVQGKQFQVGNIQEMFKDSGPEKRPKPWRLLFVGVFTDSTIRSHGIHHYEKPPCGSNMFVIFSNHPASKSKRLFCGRMKKKMHRRQKHDLGHFAVTHKTSSLQFTPRMQGVGPYKGDACSKHQFLRAKHNHVGNGTFGASELCCSNFECGRQTQMQNCSRCCCSWRVNPLDMEWEWQKTTSQFCRTSLQDSCRWCKSSQHQDHQQPLELHLLHFQKKHH